MRLLSPVLFLLCAFPLAAQTVSHLYSAKRVSTGPSIDGKLDDACWQHLPAASDFTQYLPESGKPSHFNSKVYLVYDNDAIYVGAQLDDPEPSKIATVLSPRDQRAGNSSDHFILGIDTYHDGLNGYRFEITAAGVQSDARISPQQYDMNWDAVWESRTQVNANGWAVEIRIPYSAIRFPNKPLQEWGIQFTRMVQRAGELSSWSPTDPKIENIVQQWGLLEGLENIAPPPRLSFTPYIAGYAERNPVSTDPLAYKTNYRANGGMDIKLGINESFTLDATLIPDFGQVQSDNTVLNLTPFEVRYEERRPFFTEGTELFGKGDVFYSRRIGGRPLKYYDAYAAAGANEEVESNPSQTSLYNATKFSGRTRNGLGIGMLNAVAAPSYATIRNTVTGERRDFQTGALTNFNVLVFDQNLPNNSSVSFVNASTIRNGSWRDADVSTLQLNLRNKKNSYRLRSGAHYSYVKDPAAGADASNGYTLNGDISKISGKFQFEAGTYALSKNWDPTDLSLLNAYNLMDNYLTLRWLEYEPKNKMQSWTLLAKGEYFSQFEPSEYQMIKLTATADATFGNFSSAGIYFQSAPSWYNDFYEPRVDGKKLWRAPYVYFLPYFNTDQRKPVQWFVQIEFAESPLKCDPLYGGATNLYVRVNDHFNFTVFTESTKDNRAFGFAGYDAATDQVLIGRRDVFVTNNEISMEYNINPRMGINFRVRHYWSKVIYSQFYNLRDDGRFDTIAFLPGNDFNFNVFNIDLVYSWQFAPGSFLNIVWKNNIGETDDHRADDYFVNFGKTVSSPHGDSLIVKMIYYLDYENIRHTFHHRQA